jgi:hypothetical protein
MHVHGWVIPLLVTLWLGGRALRLGRESSGDFDFGPLFALLYLIPILAVWLAYFVALRVWG